MKSYTRVRDRVVPLFRSDINTDQIIPARHLKRVVRTGYGQFLFESWRFTPLGEPHPDFVLNLRRYRDASILVTGPNFGCGSSREHAAWALHEYGFRTIIAPSFADIFRTNCYQNGILPVVLSPRDVRHIVEHAERHDEYRVTVDLHTCSVRDTMGMSQGFAIDAFSRDCLLEGLDPIDLTLRHDEEIQAFEVARGIKTKSIGAH